jgi:hypothetical protein
MIGDRASVCSVQVPLLTALESLQRHGAVLCCVQPAGQGLGRRDTQTDQELLSRRARHFQGHGAQGV